MQGPCNWKVDFGQCAVPAALASGRARALAVEAGTTFSLALMADGSARAWGSWGEVSQEGTASRISALPPLLARPAAGKQVVAIAAGAEGYALLANGDLVAFGPSYEGNYTVLLGGVISMKVSVNSRVRKGGGAGPLLGCGPSWVAG